MQEDHKPEVIPVSWRYRKEALGGIQADCFATTGFRNGNAGRMKYIETSQINQWLEERRWKLFDFIMRQLKGEFCERQKGYIYFLQINNCFEGIPFHQAKTFLG